ncbi:RDD family protein [Ferruginibacter lapsinanis]|uniref:RDD family protein n=1 Tax=Ferruginibacter lapsinanis TaxID=563172 RepID=UPI001E4CB30E|nr:RDD family protein [Ferruginibacter lapsinanis]UEG49321.1 RDD family protein [Ferruginibacter lapsinanis]
MPLIQIATPFNIDIEFEIAEFHKRLFAYMIDFFLLIIYLFSMIYVLFGGFSLGEGSIGFVFLVIFIPMIFYTLLTELWLNGQTIGKKIFKIKVVSLDGGEPTLSQYLLRWFMRFYEWGFIVFFLFWGNATWGFMILFLGGITSIIIISASKNNQRIGDIVAGTVVVNTRSNLTVHDTIFMNLTEQGYKVKFPQAITLSDRDINTIKNVLTQAEKSNNHQMCNRVATKVKDVLEITTDMYAMDFLERIMADYNYLATRE